MRNPNVEICFITRNSGKRGYGFKIIPLTQILEETNGENEDTPTTKKNTKAGASP